MKTIDLHALSANSEAAVAALKGGISQDGWTTSLKAGEKIGRPKDPVDSGELWTTSLPAGIKQSGKPPAPEE